MSLQVVPKLWFCHSLVTWKLCQCKMLLIPAVDLCFVPKSVFVELKLMLSFESAFFGPNAVKERATVLQPQEVLINNTEEAIMYVISRLLGRYLFLEGWVPFKSSRKHGLQSQLLAITQGVVSS